ncbi:MAG: DUF4169 family protein [Nevskia sp.]|nr:DUF4169 family protein [Nevskia sp.]
MTKVVNLNRYRKLKQRVADEQRANENRVRFGRSKADKARDAAADAEAHRLWDGLKREDPTPPPESNDY